MEMGISISYVSGGEGHEFDLCMSNDQTYVVLTLTIP